MIRATLLTLGLCLTQQLAASGADAAELNFTFYVLGVPTAGAVLSVDLTQSAYRIDMSFHTIGLVALISSDRLDSRTRGVFLGGLPAPLEFFSTSRLRGQTRGASMTWRDGSPIVSSLYPANSTEREEVPAALQAHTVDPLSPIVQMLRQAAATGRCDGTSRSYDGRRLQLFEATTGSEEDLPSSIHSNFSGRAMRCDFTHRGLAGFRFGSGRDDDARVRRGTIWLASLFPAAPRLPVRASIETMWLGEAMIYLNSAMP